MRQIKSVEQEKLGAKLGEATPEELAEALEIIATRLWRTSPRPSVIQTRSGYEDVERGSIFNVAFYDEDESVQYVPMLVLDYNRGNNMAIAVEVEDSQKPELGGQNTDQHNWVFPAGVGSSSSRALNRF